MFALASFARIPAACAASLALFLWHFQECLLVFGGGLRLPELDHSGNLLLGNERRVQAMNARGAGGEIEHVAFAEQGLCAVGVKNGAGVNLGGDSEGNACREVGFD